MLSYYELLGMIKEGNIPERLYVKLAQVNYGVNYVAIYDGDEFSRYELENSDDEDCNYRDYLGECFLESDMFNKCIEILDDKFEEIEEIEIVEYFDDISNRKLLELHSEEMCKVKNKVNQLLKNQKKIIERLKNEK